MRKCIEAGQEETKRSPTHRGIAHHASLPPPVPCYSFLTLFSHSPKLLVIEVSSKLALALLAPRLLPLSFPASLSLHRAQDLVTCLVALTLYLSFVPSPRGIVDHGGV